MEPVCQHLHTALRLQSPRVPASCAREGALRHILLATTYLRQDRPDVDHAVALATYAVDTLTGGSTRPAASATSPPTGDGQLSASSPSRPPDFSPSSDTSR